MADFVVSLTTKARQIEAQKLIYGFAFRIDYFNLGAGGHDTGNPSAALPLDLEVTTLPLEFFGPEPVDESELINPTCVRFTCVAQPGEAVGGLSNLGLTATITYVPGEAFLVPAADVDDTLDLITRANHGLVDDMIVTLDSTGTMPGGLVTATDYYVVSATTSTFQLSSTLAGAPEDITSAGVGGLVVTFGSVPGAPEVGSTFLYALTNFPLRNKLSASRETFLVTIKT